MSSYFEVTTVSFWQMFCLFSILHFTLYTVNFPSVVYSVTLSRVCGSQSTASWFRHIQLQFLIFSWWTSLVTQLSQMMFFWMCACPWNPSYVPAHWFSQTLLFMAHTLGTYFMAQ